VSQSRFDRRLAERQRATVISKLDAQGEIITKATVLEWLRERAGSLVLEFREDFDYWPDDGQLEVSEAPPQARSSDPATSHQAALDAWPRAKSQRSKALAAIIFARTIGMTYAEVEIATGINGVWKRLSELKQGGWIKTTGHTRLVPATGSQADVYVATNKATARFSKETE
jgi:hypothetical protein